MGGDITYVRTWDGWLFCATVIDLYSRRVIGWALADHLHTSLVGDALEMAVATRGGHVAGVVFHSDRGCQYTSSEFAELCDKHQVLQSMGATGICWDNAAAESFFATLKRELVHRHAWATPRRPSTRSSVGSKAGTTRAGCTPQSITSPRTRRRTHGTLLTVAQRNDLSVQPGQLHTWVGSVVRGSAWPFRRWLRRSSDGRS